MWRSFRQPEGALVHCQRRLPPLAPFRVVVVETRILSISIRQNRAMELRPNGGVNRCLSAWKTSDNKSIFTCAMDPRRGADSRPRATGSLRAIKLIDTPSIKIIDGISTL
jgi:hypothetical protein